MEINVWKIKSLIMLIMLNINTKKHNEETIFYFLVDISVHVVEFNGNRKVVNV